MKKMECVGFFSSEIAQFYLVSREVVHRLSMGLGKIYLYHCLPWSWEDKYPVTLLPFGVINFLLSMHDIVGKSEIQPQLLTETKKLALAFENN